MAATEEIDGCDRFSAVYAWERAMLWATRQSYSLEQLDVHKQLANRLTEPFQVIQCLVSATNLKNWFYLRDNLAAQPEIQELARAMKIAFDSTPTQKLKPGEWHLPFIGEEEQNLSLEEQRLISVARCARVSYFLVDGEKSSLEKDLELAERLLAHKHMSPLEHQAAALPKKVQVANYVGWLQYRKFIPQECQDEDNVPILNTQQALALLSESTVYKARTSSSRQKRYASSW